MTEDEKFFAWLDGELGANDAADMEKKVAADPKLAELARQHRSLGTKLSKAFDPILAAPVPKRLEEVLRPSADLIDFSSARRRRSIPSLPQWTALAATLAVGIFIGNMVPQRSNAPVNVQGGEIYAAASLNRALDTELASAPTGDVRIGITFRSSAGQICRTFTQSAASGLACRSGDKWQVKGLFGAPEGQQADYRMAAGMDPNLASLVGSLMAGDAFDAAQEKAARETGWH